MVTIFHNEGGNSCLIWKLSVKRGRVYVIGSLAVIRMRDGSTSVQLSRDTTALGVKDSGGAISMNNFLLVLKLLSA